MDPDLPDSPSRRPTRVMREAVHATETGPPPVREDAWIKQFRGRLLAFYRARARRLPWRSEKDPYRILVSEFMLQQTRVETVIPYYERWMERFPTLTSLAEAEGEEVLKLWEGLGYYSRARNLHAAAREVVGRYGGAVPSEPDALQSLSGVGPYTAGAVASIAFGFPAPAVDGNVRRVLARLTDQPDPSARVLRNLAADLVDPDNPGMFNQALMELGSLICTPRNPDCVSCPVRAHCLAQRAGTQERRPTPRTPRRTPHFIEAVAIVIVGSDADPHALLRRRPEQGLLGGMWEFPGTAVEVGQIEADGETCSEWEERARALAIRLKPLCGEGPGNLLEGARRLDPVDHAFTHRRVRYHPHVFRLSETRVPDGERIGITWVDADAVKELPLPTAQRKIAAQLWRSI